MISSSVYNNYLKHCVQIEGLSGIHGERILYNIDIVNSAMSGIKVPKNCGVCYDALNEALYSATIEGAVTDKNKVRYAKRYKTGGKSEHMVINACDAITIVNEVGLKSENDLLSLWSLMVRNVCENTGYIGNKYRSGMVYIAGNGGIVHTPQSVFKIQDSMNELFTYISKNAGVLEAVICHWFFVYIHPFCDGNGRMARLWMNYLLSCVDKKFRCLQISESIYGNLKEYYRSLEKSEQSYDGNIDITPFICYMLEIIEGCISDVNSPLPVTAVKILSKLNRGQEYTAKDIMEEFGINKNKCYELMNALSKNGFLFRYKDSNKNVYRKG